MVVDAADDHRVDFHRVQPEFPRLVDAGEDFLEAIASGNLLEIFAFERIEAKSDAPQAGFAEGLALRRKEKAVGRHRQVGEAGDPGEALHQARHFLAQQRLAAGEPHFLDAQIDADPDDALDLFEGQDVRTGLPLAGDRRRNRQVRPAPAVEIMRGLGFRQAVEAAEIAAIGDAYPQVPQDSPVRIDEQAGADHCLGGGLAGAALSPPLCRSSISRRLSGVAAVRKGVDKSRSAPFLSRAL